ncbi:hypothetical protein B0H65DRAFT_440759 [Neurospora tetraspora]|uniref:Secreted protein n=1 Tax=Neurospora tetraspora TaxID=94610 RepID=A0AAE0JLI5_9PEZI|nr:hypothetical protein B0H65DRAFT_440759 [Neurospora tetraspora]
MPPSHSLLLSTVFQLTWLGSLADDRFQTVKWRCFPRFSYQSGLGNPWMGGRGPAWGFIDRFFSDNLRDRHVPTSALTMRDRRTAGLPRDGGRLWSSGAEAALELVVLAGVLERLDHKAGAKQPMDRGNWQYPG